MNTRKLITFGLAVLTLGISTPLFAQEDEEILILETLESNDIPVEESILPTTRPFNSVYGTDRSVLDTPRNVTIISREQLDAISIQTPRDFSKLTSSSYTKSNFGAPTTPNLRGQEADLFINGMRMGLTSNGNGLPINFNAVESANIVKGPAGAVYGTSSYQGGYADLITKKPFFDQNRGYATLTVGSYEQLRWQLDYSWVLSETSAFRISYSGEESNSFYEFGKKNTQAIYGAYTWRPDEVLTIELSAQYFQADYTENWGMNRPTQALIDDGLYIPNSQTDAEYEAYVANLGNGIGSFSFGDNPQPGVNQASVFGGAGFATIAPLDVDNPVKLDRSKRLLAPGDDSFGRNVQAQLIATWNISDQFSIQSNSFYQWIDRQTFSSYHYSELLRDNWSFDNRTEFRFDYDIGENMNVSLNTGARFRYQEVWSVNHFFNEPVNFWDLTRDPDTRRVPDQGFAGFPTIPDEPARGILDAWYYGGTGADTDGYILGGFVQGDFQINEKFSLLAGINYDYVSARARNPVDGSGEIDDQMFLPNWNISPIYKINENLTAYVTFNASESHPVDTGGRFDPAAFDNPEESELFEVGLKGSYLNNTLFFSTAFVDRTFEVSNQDNTRDTVWVNTFEFELNYQPNPNFFATFGYSYLDAERTLSFFASAYTADRADETGGLFIQPTFPSPADPEQRLTFPGSPEHLANALLSYKWDNGFGVQLNFQSWGPMNLGFEGFEAFVFEPLPGGGLGDGFPITVNTVEVPWSYEVDLTVMYETGPWDFRLTAFNVTDEENWDAPNAGYGNGSVVARLPTTLEFTARYNF
ncbi:MAG: TonB-dependent receptor [Opitutales bacterium]